MNWSAATKVVLLVAVVGLSIWTAITGLFGTPGSSISGHIRDYGHAYPVVPYSLGFLLGHWFSSTATPIWLYERAARWALSITFAVGLVCILAITVLHAMGEHVGEPKWWHPLMFLFLGVMHGRTFWTMKPVRKLPPIYTFEKK